MECSLAQAAPTAKAPPFRFNPLRSDIRTNPYPAYHRLRIEAPMHKTLGFIGTEWFLTRFADVKLVLSDARFRIDPLPVRIRDKGARHGEDGGFDALTRSIDRWLFFLDPPDHTRLRRFVGRAFAVGAIERLRGFIQETTDELFSSIPTGRPVDAMATVAYPLTALVTAHLLGLPRADCDRLTRWSRELFWVFDQPMSLAGYARLDTVAAEFAGYFASRFSQSKRRPADSLLDHLVAGADQDGGLTEAEALSFCAMIFSVGQETTASAIGSGLMALALHPQQQELLREDPELLNGATEELLRYESPTQVIARVAVEDIELGGTLIKAGERVIASLGAANRDPGPFPQPDRLDLSRANGRNLAFGGGIHHCLGASLARTMCQACFGGAIGRFASLKLADESLKWRNNFIVRGPERLSIVAQA